MTEKQGKIKKIVRKAATEAHSTYCCCTRTILKVPFPATKPSRGPLARPAISFLFLSRAVSSVSTSTCAAAAPPSVNRSTEAKPTAGKLLLLPRHRIRGCSTIWGDLNSLFPTPHHMKKDGYEKKKRRAVCTAVVKYGTAAAVYTYFIRTKNKPEQRTYY